MATFPFNIAKGRVAEFHNRVKVGDPAAARLYVIPLSATPSQATAQDVDDFAALITAGATEATTNGWARITLAAADLTALTPDDTNDRMPADSIDLNFGSPTAGTNTVAVVYCYASVATPTNAQLTPMTHHDFAITADGTAVTGTVADYFRAS
jgi:hypothetical protein